MAATRTFEGTSLPEVLGKVQAELGDAATIVSATKRRTGGVGGFFSKEVFEVVASAPERPTATPAAAAVAPAAVAADPLSALLGLADAASAAERATTPVRTPVAAPAPPAAPAGAGLPGTFAAFLASRIAEAEAVEPTPQVVAPATTTPSPATAVAPSPMRGVVAPVEPEALAEAPAPAFSALYDRAVALAATPTLAAASLDLREAPVRPEPAEQAPADPSRRGGPRRQPRVRPAFADAPRLRRDERGLVDDVVVPAEDDVLAGGDDAVPAGRVPSGVTLTTLGLPVGYLPEDELDVAALAGALATLPAAPAVSCRLRGALVVVGAPEAARRLAAQLADVVLEDPDAVLVAQRDEPDVAPWQWLRTPADVAARRAGWVQRDTPVVVALCVPADEDDLRWATTMAEALRPTVLQVAVPAAAGADEVRGVLDELPPVDGLHLVGVATAPAPAAALAVGTPVVSLDGVPATAGVWAELLVGRVRRGQA